MTKDFFIIVALLLLSCTIAYFFILTTTIHSNHQLKFRISLLTQKISKLKILNNRCDNLNQLIKLKKRTIKNQLKVILNKNPLNVLISKIDNILTDEKLLVTKIEPAVKETTHNIIIKIMATGNYSQIIKFLTQLNQQLMLIHFNNIHLKVTSDHANLSMTCVLEYING